MPLGDRAGDTGKSRYCGIETEFSYDITNVIAHNVLVGGFDFVVTPLRHPEYRPSNIGDNLRFADSDYKVTTEEWSDHIVGKISTWIDLDSEDETLRLDSELAFKQEVAWASYLSVQACLLPAPKGTCFVNYARCVNHILGDIEDTQLWLRIPLGDDDSSARSSTSVDIWETWNSFRLLCDHHGRVLIVLDILNPLPSDNSLERWFGEPVIAAIIHTDDYFSTKARGNNKYLSRRMQKLITDFFNHSIQIIISGKQDPAQADSKEHPLRPHRDYVGYLYQRMDPLTERESLEFGVRDFLDSPLQPLKNYSLFLTYADFEKDAVKYLQYEKAICQALLDRVPDEKASETTIVLMVVGAGRGPLVRASLKAAKETGRKLRVYAVEKNEHAFFALNELIRLEGWVNSVIPVLRDVRYWHAPEKADIMVSELLGSFGDNELSPECLDGAQRYLKNNGISIPSSYTSFLQPVAASKYYNDIKARKDGLNFETPCVVNIHNVARLAPTQPVFTFTHRKHYDLEGNQRYKKLLFVIPSDTGSVMVHGFAGYFDATLYKDVHVGIEPSTKTPNLFSWFAMFFPLKTPIFVVRGSTLEVHFWRCYDSTKVWYEWCVASPSSPIHNCNGSSYSVAL